MNKNESMKFCKDKIEEYEKEIQKLEKQKIEYLEVDKVPPRKNAKRIEECRIIITYYENLLNKIARCEDGRLTSQLTATLRF